MRQISMKQNQIRQSGRMYVIASLVLLFFCAAVSARAAEEGGSSATDRANEIFKWINFAIVAAVLVWLLSKKFPGWVRGNADKNRSATTQPTPPKEEAERHHPQADAQPAHMTPETAPLHA